MLRRFTYGLRWLRNKVLVTIFAFFPMGAFADTVHILALGDSLTQGYGLMEHEGFVPQLRDWMAQSGSDVRIVNGGVSGDTTAGGLSRVEWSLTPEIQAMIVALGGNDLLRGVPPETARANLEGILTVAQSHGLEVLLIGMEAPGNYGPDYKQAFDAIYPDLAQAYDTLYLGNFFAGLLQGGAPPEDLAEVMQPDGIHPNSQGVARIVEVVGPLVQDLVGRVEAAGQ